MKTLLIYPPFIRLHRIKYRFFPIGLGYLAGALRNAGKPCAIYNAENFDGREPLVDRYTYLDNYELFQNYQDALDDPAHYVWNEYREVLEREQPDIVGISCKSCMVPSAQIMSRIAKEWNPDVKVIWGGPHASINPDETILYDHVDFVARHEGEHTLVDFVGMCESGDEDWSAIPGLVWKDAAGRVIHNPRRENDPNIENDVCRPDKTVDVFPDRYNPDHYGVVFSTRGCPWPCTFCDSQGVWQRGIRYRSIENVVAEMEHLYEDHGVRNFLFWDDTFTPNRKHSIALFDLMIERFHKRGRPITWQATTRCDCVDDELAAKMKESGCRLLTFGIETGSPSMMKILKKGITHDKVWHCDRVLKKAGIPWEAFFMIGFPDDDRKTIGETMDLIRQLGVIACISIFTPYPNTEMYDRAKQYGLIDEPMEWRYYSHQSPNNHFVKALSKEEFEELSHECLAEVDRLNARRYYMNRLRHYARHPFKVPRKLLSVVGAALTSRRVRRSAPAVGIGNLPHSTDAEVNGTSKPNPALRVSVDRESRETVRS